MKKISCAASYDNVKEKCNELTQFPDPDEGSVAEASAIYYFIYLNKHSQRFLQARNLISPIVIDYTHSTNAEGITSFVSIYNYDLDIVLHRSFQSFPCVQK